MDYPEPLMLNEKKSGNISSKTEGGMLRLHSLFGIFWVFKEGISRPLRVLIYYIYALNLLGSLKFLFSGEYDHVENGIIGFTILILVGIIRSCVVYFIERCSTILKILCIFISVSFLGTISYFSIIEIIEMKSEKEINEWGFAYTVAILTDVLFLSIIWSFIRIKII